MGVTGWRCSRRCTKRTEDHQPELDPAGVAGQALSPLTEALRRGEQWEEDDSLDGRTMQVLNVGRSTFCGCCLATSSVAAYEWHWVVRVSGPHVFHLSCEEDSELSVILGLDDT